MNRRSALLIAFLPLLGGALQGGLFLRTAYQNFRTVQRSQRAYRRSLVSGAIEAADRSVTDKLKQQGYTLVRPYFGVGHCVSEAAMPGGAFQLPTGEWWPRDTFVMHTEIWSVEGTATVRSRNHPGETVTIPCKTMVRWNPSQNCWQTLSTVVPYKGFAVGT